MIWGRRAEAGGTHHTPGEGATAEPIPGDGPDPISPLSPTEFFFDENPDARLRFTLKEGRGISVLRYDVDGAPGCRTTITPVHRRQLHQGVWGSAEPG